MKEQQLNIVFIS